MPSTYLSLHYHIVFATKHRHALIDAEWRGRLHAYLGGIVKGHGGIPESIGGVEDHVHLLLGLRATHKLSDFMRDLKAVSSGWVHDEILLHSFEWQEGYAAFTVGARERAMVRTYIENQEAHHRKESSADELRRMLEEAGIAYDPRYFD